MDEKAGFCCPCLQKKEDCMKELEDRYLGTPF